MDYDRIPDSTIINNFEGLCPDKIYENIYKNKNKYELFHKPVGNKIFSLAKVRKEIKTLDKLDKEEITPLDLYYKQHKIIDGHNYDTRINDVNLAEEMAYAMDADMTQASSHQTAADRYKAWYKKDSVSHPTSVVLSGIYRDMQSEISQAEDHRAEALRVAKTMEIAALVRKYTILDMRGLE